MHHFASNSYSYSYICMMYFTFYNVVYIVKFYNLDAHDVLLLLFTLLNGLRF